MSDDGKAENHLQTLGRSEITHNVSFRLKQPEKEVRNVLEEMLEEIAKALEQDDEVKFSNFGTFKLLKKNERIARNPKTKEPAIVSPRRVITYKAAISMIERTSRSLRNQ